MSATKRSQTTNIKIAEKEKTAKHSSKIETCKILDRKSNTVANKHSHSRQVSFLTTVTAVTSHLKVSFQLKSVETNFQTVEKQIKIKTNTNERLHGLRWRDDQKKGFFHRQTDTQSVRKQ